MVACRGPRTQQQRHAWTKPTDGVNSSAPCSSGGTATATLWGRLDRLHTTTSSRYSPPYVAQRRSSVLFCMNIGTCEPARVWGAARRSGENTARRHVGPRTLVPQPLSSMVASAALPSANLRPTAPVKSPGVRGAKARRTSVEPCAGTTASSGEKS